MLPEPFTTKDLSEILQLGAALADKVFKMDPQMERSIQFKRQLEAALQPYKDTYRALQSTLTGYLDQVATPSTTALEPSSESDPSTFYGFEEDSDSDNARSRSASPGPLSAT